MKSFFYLFSAILLFAGNIHAQEGYPTPPQSFESLFYIQRSGNANTIVYDASFMAHQKLDKKKPINIYWIRYTDGGVREGLSFIQRNLAYGVSVNSLGENNFEFHLVSYARKKFTLELDSNGRPRARAEVNGKQMVIRRIYVSIEKSSLWSLAPKVQYVDFYGTDPWSGKPMFEKFYP